MVFIIFSLFIFFCLTPISLVRACEIKLSEKKITNEETSLFYGFSEPKTLEEACKMGNIEAAKDFISKGADVNQRNLRGETLLHVAVGADSFPIVSLLINNGADVAAKSSSGWTPLHVWAANRGDSAILDILIEKNSSLISIKDEKGNSPFLIVCLYHNVRTALWLLKKGAFLLDKNEMGETWIHCAAILNTSPKEFIEAILNNTIDRKHLRDWLAKVFEKISIDSSWAKAFTEKMKKALENQKEEDEYIQNYLEELKKLIKEYKEQAHYLKEKMDKETDSRDGKMVELNFLSGCFELFEEHKKVAGEFFSKEDYIFKKQIEDLRMFSLSEKEREDLCDIQKKISLINSFFHSKTNAGKTVLHFTCQHCSRNETENLEFLFEKGALLEEKDNEGKTAFHYACMAGNKVIVQYLLSKKNDLINEISGENLAPLDYALRSERFETILFLVERGALCIEQIIAPGPPSFLHVLARYASCISILEKFLEYHKRSHFIYLKINGKTVNSENTPLHCAALTRNVQAYNLLVAYGADTEIRNRKEQMPRDLFSASLD